MTALDAVAGLMGIAGLACAAIVLYDIRRSRRAT
jgi:hypothetical protein